jgi:G3E family GTPase
VDPERVRDFLLEERRTSFPEEVSYLFKKQIEEADIIVLNKVDLLTENEKQQLLGVLEKHFPEKQIEAVSAREDLGLNHWLEALLSGKPGANTVLSQIDYDRYATAEAILGWLNAAVKLSSKTPFDPKTILETLALKLNEAFGANNAEIGHLKFVMTSAGDAVWANLTHMSTQPAIGGQQTGAFSTATLLINARVKITPEALESMVRNCVSDISRESGMRYEILDLQCFSPAYPEPPYLMRDTAE